MKTFLGMKTASEPEFKYMTWEVSYFGWCIGSYNNVKSTDEQPNKILRLIYAVEALKSLKKIREMDEETYTQLRTDYRATIIQMNSTIKTY